MHARAIEHLLYQYAEAIDGGNFAGVAELFRYGEISSPSGGTTRGYEEVLALYNNATRLYENGTPCTRHVTSNPIIEIDENNTSATCRSYFTVMQALPDFPLQAIIAGRYHDSFERVDGQWRFKTRLMLPELLGDLSRHLLFDPVSLS